MRLRNSRDREELQKIQEKLDAIDRNRREGAFRTTSGEVLPGQAYLHHLLEVRALEIAPECAQR